MLEAVLALVPDSYPLFSPLIITLGVKSPSSPRKEEGDPLGPLLFCLTIYCHCCHLKSELCVMYLDDVTLGGSTEDLLHDIIRSTEDLGLSLNNTKSEIICQDQVTRGTIVCD